MKTLLRSLTFVAAALLVAGCKSRNREILPAEAVNQPVYTKVGMRFDTKRGRYLMYSTNYLSMPTFVPMGTQLTLEGMTGRSITLRDGDGNQYYIDYVAKHSQMPITEWKERHFSDTPVAMPEGLSEVDRAGIESGEIRRGMSRDAVFLAVGYPPKSTNPSETANTLTYEWRRFVSRSVRFDGEDKVDQVGL